MHALLVFSVPCSCKDKKRQSGHVAWSTSEINGANYQLPAGGGPYFFFLVDFLAGFCECTRSFTCFLSSKLKAPGAADPSPAASAGLEPLLALRSATGTFVRLSPLTCASMALIGFFNGSTFPGSDEDDSGVGGGFGGSGTSSFSRTDGILSKSVWEREKAFAVDQ
mmetsp:Transcript_12086/g.23936  ORF Transcript_12086/g.23936 Transcript_12086/m.23936 type:complete len:166 (-) Transcript_12086:522-1019(-)